MNSRLIYHQYSWIKSPNCKLYWGTCTKGGKKFGFS